MRCDDEQVEISPRRGPPEGVLTPSTAEQYDVNPITLWNTLE